MRGLLVASAGQVAGLGQVPNPPQTYIDTSLAATPVTGNVTNVGSADDLQAAIDRAAPGDELVLQASATYTGNFILRQKPGSGWITITSSALSSLPGPGSRVGPQDAANMPIVVSPNTGPAFQTEQGAHQYRLMGLEITVVNQSPLNYGLVFLGTGVETNPNQLPVDIFFDRMYIHGEVLCHCKSGIQLNGINAAVVDSYISDFHGIGQDTQAIIAYATPGPLKITNTELEGSGENLLFGGSYAILPGVVQSDMVIRGNHFFKPLGWQTSIIPPPADVTATVQAGGSIPPGQYWYSVVARGTEGYYTSPGSGWSGISLEVPVNVTAGQQSVLVSWSSVSYGDAVDNRNADSYDVMRTTQAPSDPNRQWSYLAATGNSATDTAAAPPAWTDGYLPQGLHWEVKNLLELKNAQRAAIDGNVLENNWADAQNGMAILLTPRVEVSTAGPPMYQNVVQDIAILNNTLNHSPGAVNLLGYDNDQCGAVPNPCQQTQRVLIANNLLTDISQQFGQGFAFEGGETGGSTSVIIDHNTLINDGLDLQVDIPEGTLLLTNNIFPYNQYGIHGDGLGSTPQVLSTDFSSNIFAGNIYAEAGAADCGTPPNYCPATLQDVGFVDLAGGNYQLSSMSPYRGMATDGSDPGANLPVLDAYIANASNPCSYSLSQNMANSSYQGGPVTISITTSPSCGWLAESGASWIEVQSPAAGVGTAAVTLNVDANSLSDPRRGTVLMGTQVVTVYQASGSHKRVKPHQK